MLLIVGLSFCSVMCADTCLIARGMAERSSPTAALNVIIIIISYLIMTRTLIGMMEAVR